MKTGRNPKRAALWCLTENGCRLASRLVAAGDPVDCFISGRLSGTQTIPVHSTFKRLAISVERVFQHYSGHVFFMSAGIVVRMIAPLIRHKTVDPAVVVVDDAGKFAISLLAGHLGGANDLARSVAERIGAIAVVTTATDAHQVPAIDVMAQKLGLAIENPDAIKQVNMAFLQKLPVSLHDPGGKLIQSMPQYRYLWHMAEPAADMNQEVSTVPAGVYVGDIQVDLPPQFLILRPASLVAGIGCNRNTPAAEIDHLLMQVLSQHRLSFHSLVRLASISLKKDEKGLLELAAGLNLPITFYDKDQLARVDGVENPSETVKKYTGVPSVCEAAAILAAQMGELIVPKHTTRNVTVAIARIPSML